MNRLSPALILADTMVACCVAPPGARAEPRTALVIGNADYASAPLLNPANDAIDVAGKLGELGFEVIHELNLDRAGMRSAVRDFEGRLRKKGGVGLFYYAGHALQVNGRNFLVPVNAQIEREYEVEDASIDAGLVLSAMEYAGSDVNIVILDACRNNPFRSFRSLSRGLAQMEGPTGSLIAYSTAPGKVASDGDGRNSPYVKQLLQHMDAPGLPIEQLFKRVRLGVKAETGDRQIPWETSSLTGNFQFVAGLSPTPVQPARTGPTDSEVELEYWESVRDADDARMYRAYLEQYPDGQFASLATIALQKIKDKDVDQRTERSTAAILVDPRLVGTWEVYVTTPQGVSHWVQTIGADATFEFYATGPGAPPRQSGSFRAMNGRFELQSPSVNWIDGGTYRMLDADTLELNGKLGPGVWSRRR